MSKILIGFGLFFGAALVLAAQWLSGDLPQATIAVAGGFALLLAAYLGLDLTAALNRSFTLPKGQIEQINIFKYVFALVCLFLLALAMVISFVALKNVNDTALSIIVYALYFILATWIASRKLSKVAQNSGKISGGNNEQTQNAAAVCGGAAAGRSNYRGVAGAGESPAAAGQNCRPRTAENAPRGVGAATDQTGPAQSGGGCQL